MKSVKLIQIMDALIIYQSAVVIKIGYILLPVQNFNGVLLFVRVRSELNPPHSMKILT